MSCYRIESWLQNWLLAVSKEKNLSPEAKQIHSIVVLWNKCMYIQTNTPPPTQAVIFLEIMNCSCLLRNTHQLQKSSAWRLYLWSGHPIVSKPKCVIKLCISCLKNTCLTEFRFRKLFVLQRDHSWHGQVGLSSHSEELLSSTLTISTTRMKRSGRRKGGGVTPNCNLRCVKTWPSPKPPSTKTCVWASPPL